MRRWMSGLQGPPRALSGSLAALRNVLLHASETMLRHPGSFQSYPCFRSFIADVFSSAA